MGKAIFDGWPVLARTVLVGVAAYAVLVALLRATGNRTLSKMNAFDFVVTVALGSTLAAVLLDRNVTLAQGALAFGVLIGLQLAITWSSVRVRWFRRFVTGDPALLFFRGRFLDGALRRARVTRDEIRAAVRGAGSAQLDDVEAVVMETDGSFSVVRTAPAGESSSLEGVEVPRSARDDGSPRPGRIEGARPQGGP